MTKQTLLTIQVLANSEQLAEIKKFGMMLVKERPGLCWEPMPEVKEDEETEVERCR